MSDLISSRTLDGSDFPPPIEILFSPLAPAGFAAIVVLCGEHDLASAVDLQDALDSIHGNAVVDLSACEFIDSTIIGVLVRDQLTRLREGHRLELLVPTENQSVSRTLEVSGIAEIVNVRTGPPDSA